MDINRSTCSQSVTFATQVIGKYDTLIARGRCYSQNSDGGICVPGARRVMLCYHRT